MYSETELRQLTYKELYGLCKQYNLPRFRNRGRLSKAVMVENLLEFFETIGLMSMPDISTCSEEEIEDASFGDIVAFLVGKDKALSGKLIARSRKRKKIKVETKKKDVFVVEYKDIIWFKGDAQWPKPVYAILKG